MIPPRILPFGDAALLVALDTATTIASARRASALARAVTGMRTAGSGGAAGLGVPVAGAASVLVPFDPFTTDADGVSRFLLPLLADAAATDPGAVSGAEHVIRVRYGGAEGPDLGSVATVTGLAPHEVVALHTGTVYEVLFLGFAPGFAYLGELPPQLVLPRRATPRTRVPAGSVAIAGPTTAVYPGASAGGWHLLGRADVRLFDPAARPPALLRPGDRVRFEPA